MASGVRGHGRLTRYAPSNTCQNRGDGRGGVRFLHLHVRRAGMALLSVTLLVSACSKPARQESAGKPREVLRSADPPRASQPVDHHPAPQRPLSVVPKLYAVRTNEPVVALTFDDGPDPTNTPQILDLLVRYDAHATFFVLGTAAERYPGLVRRTAANGNEVGNHGWSHHRMTSLATSAVIEDIRRGSRQITQLVDRRPDALRPPYGAYNERVVKAANDLGETVVLWSIDTHDWTNPPPSRIARRILWTVRPGSIILLHDGGGPRASTIRALPMILRGLRRRGYHVVPVKDLVRVGAAISQDPDT